MAILGIHVSFQGVYILKTIHSPLREMLVTTFQSPSCHQKAPKLPVETSSLWPKKLGIIQLNLSITLLCQEPLHGCAPNHFEGPRLAVTIRNYDPSWMNSILQYDLNVSSFFFCVCVCVSFCGGKSNSFLLQKKNAPHLACKDVLFTKRWICGNHRLARLWGLRDEVFWAWSLVVKIPWWVSSTCG